MCNCSSVCLRVQTSSEAVLPCMFWFAAKLGSVKESLKTLKFYNVVQALITATVRHSALSAKNIAVLH